MFAYLRVRNILTYLLCRKKLIAYRQRLVIVKDLSAKTRA